MANQSRQALVILGPSVGENVADSIAAQARVTQIASPRVFIVSGDSSSVDNIARLPGVSHVLTGLEAPQDIADLNEQESLFVKSWLVSQQPKARGKTEGLAWDKPGFQPPDPPKK
jgi:hypothetical protein